MHVVLILVALLFLVVAILLFVNFLDAIPTRLKNFENWIAGLFDKRTARAAVKDAVGLFVPWSGRLQRGAFVFCLLLYVIVLMILFTRLGWFGENSPWISASESVSEDAMWFSPLYAFAKSFSEGDSETRTAVVTLVASFYLPLVFVAKRLRDAEIRWQWIFALLVPYVWLFALFVLVLMSFLYPGTDGPNQYGRDPSGVYRPSRAPESGRISFK